MEDLTDILKVIGGALTGAVALLGGQKVKGRGATQEPTPDPQRAKMIDVMHEIAEKLGQSHERMDRNHAALITALKTGREDHGRIEAELRDLRGKISA